MSKHVLLIIAPKDFRDEELFHTKEEIEKAGHRVTIASNTRDIARGMFGGQAKPDITIDAIDVDNFDAIVFVGGSGSSVYFNDVRCHQLAQDASDKGKVVGAICIAPSTLANAGLLKGKRVTSWPSEKTNIERKGGKYTGKLVERDGKIITGNGPEAAREFGKSIVKSL